MPRNCLCRLEVSVRFVYNTYKREFLLEGVFSMGEPTAIFSIHDDQDREIREVLTEVYDALKEKGYNPVNQLVGYILSEDPTYITTYRNARNLIRRIDSDDLLQALVRSYLEV